MEYKFNKDFGFFKANDVLTWDEDLNSFTMDVKEENSFRSAMIDVHTVEDMYNKGILSAGIEPEDNKINNAVELIDSLLEQYDKDYEDVMQKYKDGNIQPCVKVEAETVYYNLNKVLNKIKDTLINE